MNINQIKKTERMLRDTLAPQYEEWVFRTKGELWDKMERVAILNAVRPQGSDLILDAGCGVGRHSILLAKRAKMVISIDFSVESLKILKTTVREKGTSNIRIISSDLTEPFAFSDCSFDKILSSQVLQHIPSAIKRLDAAKEFLRVLKPGGLLVAVLYRWGGAIRSLKEGFFDNGLYRYAFTQTECTELLREAGFSNVRVSGMINLPGLRFIPRALWGGATYTEILLGKISSASMGKFFIVSGRKRGG